MKKNRITEPPIPVLWKKIESQNLWFQFFNFPEVFELKKPPDSGFGIFSKKT
jgi:hypothetical protein